MELKFNTDGARVLKHSPTDNQHQPHHPLLTQSPLALPPPNTFHSQMELKFNSDGAKVLKAYQQNAGQAPLLLVHKTKLPNGKMGSYACDG